MSKKSLIFFLFFLSACSDSGQKNEKAPLLHHKGEFLSRAHDEFLFVPSPPLLVHRASYPWETGVIGNHPKITKEFFRCKGSSLNPVRTAQLKGEIARYYDCGGGFDKHSLPLRDNKEFIYPILPDILNYIQGGIGKRVVITCGHRCPDHNVYSDPTPENQCSKHMIGAEVSFYVQGMEEKPEIVIEWIQKYYRDIPKYKGLADYLEFKRYEKTDTNVSTQPWYNKEIFIKLFKKKEGRNYDNRHPYPYIGMQVRYDWDAKEKVIYTWPKAHLNFLRK